MDRLRANSDKNQCDCQKCWYFIILMWPVWIFSVFTNFSKPLVTCYKIVVAWVGSGFRRILPAILMTHNFLYSLCAFFFWIYRQFCVLHFALAKYIPLFLSVALLQVYAICIVAGDVKVCAIMWHVLVLWLIETYSRCSTAVLHQSWVSSWCYVLQSSFFIMYVKRRHAVSLIMSKC